MQIGLGIGTTFRQRWNPLLTEQIRSLLFSASEPGAWYDPSDMSTLWQDSAGTTPVTAVEQPVGRLLDKSGRGNHALQATTTKRPVLSRRVNQMPSSSGVGVAPWQIVAGNTSSTSGTGVLPVVTAGASTLDGEPVNRVILSVAGGTTSSDRSGMFLNMSVVGPFSVCIKSLNATPSTTVAAAIVFNTGGTKSIVSLSDDWVRIDGTTSLGTTVRVQLLGTGGLDYADFLIGKASVTLATDAHLPYQRVNTATDYDADPAKYPAYLRFDGVDDALQTGNIDFTSTDKMTVWAGITKMSDAATSILLESSANTNSNPRSFYITAPELPGTRDLSFRSLGSLATNPVKLFGNAAPISRVVAAIGDIGGDIATIRAGGASATSPQDQGTGNYGNYPLYIGARAGTSFFFNGRLYSLIVRGAQTPLSQIEATELYIKQKMRMP